MTNENDFTGDSVLFADILGFSKHTLEQRKQAEKKLRKFGKVFDNLVKKYNKYDNKKIKDEIDKRIKELDCEIIKYFEKTRKHVDDFTFQDGNKVMGDYMNKNDYDS